MVGETEYVVQRLARIAVALLSAQLTAPAASDRARGTYGRAYILGFCDALLLAQGIEGEGSFESLRSAVFVGLFGESDGRRVAELALREIEEESSLWAQARGAQDLLDWRERALSGSARPKPPTGLSAHVRG